MFDLDLELSLVGVACESLFAMHGCFDAGSISYCSAAERYCREILENDSHFRPTSPES